MPTELKSIKTLRDRYQDIIIKEVSKLKSGHGISIAEMAEKCGISKSQFRAYEFTKQFKTEEHNKLKYFVK